MTPEELKMLGASDLSALVNLNPYRTAFDVYRRITTGEETPDNKLFRRGRLLEPVIRVMAEEDYGLKLLGKRSLKDAARPWLRMSLDEVHQGPEGEEAVEFKSVNVFAADKYGESGTDEVPMEHICQVQAYLAGLRAPRGRLYALIGFDDLREYVLRADLEFQSMLYEAADRFWVDNIRKGVPPAVDASESCREWLAVRYPKNTGNVLRASTAAEVWANGLRAARAKKAEAEEAEAACRNNLVAAIGDADGIEGEGWRITHTLVKGREVTDWEAIAKAAGVPAALIQKHTKRGAGYRRFLPTFKESK